MYAYSIEQLPEVARLLANQLKPQDVLGISGDLGAGKTTLTKHLAHQWGIDMNEVTSPTYVYHHTYQGNVRVDHFDLYRVDSEATLLDLDIESVLEHKSQIIVEWVNLFPELFSSYLEIQLVAIDEHKRSINLISRNWPEEKLAAMHEALGEVCTTS